MTSEQETGAVTTAAATAAAEEISGSSKGGTNSVTFSNNGNAKDSATPYVSMDVAMLEQGEQDDIGDDDDKEDELEKLMEKSIVSSVLTADGIHDVPGFFVVCWVILIGDMARGVMFPSMWPLVQELGGSHVTLGYSVASFSFGRIMVNPIFGSWSIRYGYTKTLAFSCSLLLVGTLTYTQIQNVGYPQFLIIAQTILGIGSGTLGVTRAFIADVTAKRSRTTYMAWITAVQYGGFTVTPFIGALITYLFDDKEFIYLGFIRFNMYTVPAYFMSIITLLTLGLIAVYFQDRHRIEIQKDSSKSKSSRRLAIEDYANNLVCFSMITIYDCCILGCMLLNISTKGSIASFETLGISFASSLFDMESAQAGTVVATCGTLGVIALLSMGYLVERFNDIQLIAAGMLCMAVGIASLTEFDEENGGENPHWRYIFAIFLIYSVGYPIGHTAVIGMFSKIVGRRPQGTLLGWFASAGSLGRIMFPIMSGYIANFSSVTTLFFVLIGVLIASTIFVFLSRRTLMLLSS